MRKLLFILIAIIVNSFNLFAQITFQKTFDGSGIYDAGQSIQQTMDGGYIMTGMVDFAGTGDYDVCLMKTDSDGDTLWTKTYGGTDDDYGISVQQTTDGGYVVCGRTSINGGLTDVLLIRTDANGDSLWTKTYGENNDDVIYSVQQTFDGGFILAGWTKNFGAVLYEVYLIKTDPDGNLIWSKTYGGLAPDIGTAVKQTTDGGYIIAGYTRSFTNQFSFDGYLIKTTANGDSIWTKTYGGTENEWIYSVQQTMDGGYIIAGETKSFGSGGWDVYLLKTDSNGNSLWARSFGGVNDDYGYSVKQTNDGGFIIAGYTNSFGAGNNDAYLIRTDGDGDTLWVKTYGGTNDDRGYDVQQTSDGGFIIIGSTNSFGAGSNNIYLIRTDSLGNSGCNQGNSTTVVTTPSIIELSTTTDIGSAATIVSNPAKIVGSGGIMNTLCTSVGINESANEKFFFVSPNPTTGKFTISFKGMIEKGNVEIINLPGEIVMDEFILNESKKEMDLQFISAGLYFVKVFDGEKHYCSKIIVN